MSDSVTVLTDLDTLAVSLVRRGANQRRVAVTKSEEAMSEEQMEEVLKAVLEIEADGEDKIEEIFKELSPKGARAVKSAMRILGAFEEELPKDVLTGLAKLSKLEAPTKKQDDEGKDKDKYPTPKKAEKKAEKEEDKVKKSLDSLPEEIRAQLEGLWKGYEERIAKTEKDNVELAKALSTERDARIHKEMVAKAEENYGSLGKAEEIGVILKDLHGASDELAGKVEGLLKSANEKISKSALLEEAGSNNADAGGDASAKMDALTKERVEKSEGKLDKYTAYDQVVKEHPELYNEYLAEKKGAH